MCHAACLYVCLWHVGFVDGLMFIGALLTPACPEDYQLSRSLSVFVSNLVCIYCCNVAKYVSFLITIDYIGYHTVSSKPIICTVRVRRSR
jgi:hypothetical protein